MDNILLKKLVIIPTVCAIGVIMILTADDSGYAQNTKKRNGLNFQVAEDWPIEKRGGIVAPIPTEEYISIKFKATEEEFQAIKVDLISKFEELQLNIKNVEINFTKEIQKAQSQADFSAGTGEDLKNILSRLDLLEGAIGRLDQKITMNASLMKAQTQETAVTISSFEKKIKELQTEITKFEEVIEYIMDKRWDSY